MSQPQSNAPHPLIAQYMSEYRDDAMSRREFFTRSTSLGVSIASAYSLLGLVAPKAASADEHKNPNASKALRIAISLKSIGDPRLFDWPEQAWIANAWLEYLVAYNNDGTLEPFLLESWEVNEDATVYRLKIRENIRWNDGTAFTIDDVIFNIRRWCDATVVGNSMANRLQALVDPNTNQMREGAIVRIDEHSLELVLEEADITIIAGFSDYPALIVPQDFRPENMIDTMKGTGPWRLRDKIKGEIHETGRVIFEKHPDHDWWGQGLLSHDTLETIELIDFGTDSFSWVQAAQNDECDMFYETSGEAIELLDAIGWEQSQIATGATLVIRTHQNAETENGQKVFADASVRTALSMAVDNGLLLELGYGGRGIEAQNSHVGPIHPEYDGTVLKLPFDPARAKALIDAKGLGSYEFELVSSDESFHADTCAAMVAMLQEAGIRVRLKIISGSTYWQNWKTYPFSATAWNHRPLGVQVLNLAYHSKGVWNETGFSNTEFDQLLKKASGTALVAERREIMGKLQRILIDEGVITQPYWRSLYRHHKPGLKGAEINRASLPQYYKIYWHAE